LKNRIGGKDRLPLSPENKEESTRYYKERREEHLFFGVNERSNQRGSHWGSKLRETVAKRPSHKEVRDGGAVTEKGSVGKNTK